MKFTTLLSALILLTTAPISSWSQSTPPHRSSSYADTWSLPDTAHQFHPRLHPGPPRPGKYVGIFYFLTPGAHGYDSMTTCLPDEGVMPKSPGDTLSPYNVMEILARDSVHPAWGPVRAPHFWSEPQFGYYLANDAWVIRKHAQLLADAGIDVLVMDVTNAFIYLPQFRILANTFDSLRKEGVSTPGFAFMVRTQQDKTVRRLYDAIYGKGLYKDLWFQWKGKPLLLGNPDSISLRDFFTLRESWAWSKGEEWFGNGKDKWTWVDHTPQTPGWHEDSTKAEEISVAAAEHPFSNIGRSFHDGHEPDIKTPGKGLFFAEQWKRALEVDPEFIFLTGWNEWNASRFNNSAKIMFLGRRMTRGETYFVDSYNDEYSRDIEPMRGGFADHFYYQMVENIRQFKGVRSQPVDTAITNITIDGRFGDWNSPTSVYLDDKGDTRHRNHPGWGRVKSIVNTTGRNDIVEARAAHQPDAFNFYVKTDQPLTSGKDSNWMVLYIKAKGKESWVGFTHRVNQYRKGSDRASLEVCTGGYHWKRIAWIPVAYSNNQLELQIPEKVIDTTAIDFKWSDNCMADGDPVHWLDIGDAAPNANFRYRYLTAQPNSAGQ